MNDIYIDQGDLKKYRTEIPNIVFELGLHPFSLLIYTYIKRRAGGGQNGRHFESSGRSAEKLQMSRSTFLKHREALTQPQALLDGNPLLLKKEEKKENGADCPPSFFIVDIWVENCKFHRSNSNNNSGVRQITTPCPSNGHPPSVSRTPPVRQTDTKKEEYKKEQKEEEESQPAEAAWRLSRFLFSKIQELDPKAKTPPIDKWAEDIEKLICIDGRDEEEISSIISWTFDDGFWCKSILSGRKLREKFNTLVIHKKKDKKTKSQIEDEAKQEKENLKQRNQKWVQEWIEKYHPKNLFEYANCVQIETSSGMASIGFLDDNFKNTIVNWTKQVFTGEKA